MTVTSKQVRKDAKDVYSPESEELEEQLVDVKEMAAKEKKSRMKKQVDKLTDKNGDKTLIKMERKNYSWTTQHGVTFTRDHPYQLVDDYDKFTLLSTEGFREATPQELVEFYSG